MGLLKKLFGTPNKEGASSKEIEAIFNKVLRFLNDEAAQNNLYGEPYRSSIINGLNCDQLPSGHGEFGRVITNPIPVNGSVGEAIYLSGIRNLDGLPVTFHRLGSAQNIDIYETVTTDGKVWDILYLSPYHPRKSRKAPDGYIINEEQIKYVNGVNRHMACFPDKMRRAVMDFTKTFSIPMLPAPQVLSFVETGLFEMPQGHRNKRGKLGSLEGMTWAPFRADEVPAPKAQPDLVIEKLVNQAYGAQSVLLRIFAETFELQHQKIQLIEITYFILALQTFVFLRTGKGGDSEKEVIADSMAETVLTKSMKSANVQEPLNMIVAAYQRRFAEYNALIQPVFTDRGIDSDKCITLMLHIYECVTVQSARGAMIKITIATALLQGLIVDTIEFTKACKKV